MSLSLVWDSELDFHAGPDSPELKLASSREGVYSPMTLLAQAIMGCMAMDVVHILKKGRHDLQGLSVSFTGERAAEAPKRYTKVHLTFHITGPVAKDAVERAIALSHEKYCSVSNTLRQDLVFTTSIEISGAA
jgi:putative redox protein